MSDNINTNNISSILLNEKKENNKNDSQIKSKINNNDNNNSNNLNNSKTNNNSSVIYSYPICLQNEKDPLDDFKLKVIKARNKGSDVFLKNYLKFNFAKNDSNANNSQFKSKNSNNKSNNSILQGALLENNKNNLFLTQEKKLYNKLPKNINNIRATNHKDEAIDVFTSKRPIMHKSNSDIFNPYSQKSINHYKELCLIEMEKRGYQYNKRRMASLQRIALHNFSLMNMNGNHYVNGSIPSGKSDESYILETKQRKKLPGIREYICYRLKRMKENETNTPEYYLEKFRKNEKNRLPEIIDIKHSGRFRFHVFHDQYGFRKELDKRENRELKMTKEKIRDLKIMAQINKTNDPYLTDIYRRALYNG